MAKELLAYSSLPASVQAFLSSPLSGFRNKIINGDFYIWQRGESVSGALYAFVYGPDRWLMGSSGTGTPTMTMSRQAFVPGQVEVPGEPVYFGRFYGTTTGAFSALLASQRIEDVRTFAGKKVTITFYAKEAVGLTGFTLNAIQVFGSGGSASVITAALNFNSTIGWTKYQAVVTLPGIAGKILGAGSYLSLQINCPNTTVTLDLSRVSVVEGDATAESDPFSPRHIQQELALCQRYYERTEIGTNTYPAIYTSTSTLFLGFPMPFSVVKRSAPTMTVTSLLGGLFYWAIPNVAAYSANSQTGVTIITTTSSWRLQQTRQAGGATPIAGNIYCMETNFILSADAEL